MPKEMEQKNNAAGLTAATTQSQGTATNGIDVRTQSTFTRAGSITLEKSALKIEYESFGHPHVAYISAAGIRSLVGPTHMPCDVEEITEGIDGTTVICKVGRAWRSRSGRALVITTNQSQGDLMVPWSQFRKVLDRQVMKAIVSRFNPAPKPQPRPAMETSNSMSAGLARGF